jgi:hypothetical protein
VKVAAAVLELARFPQAVPEPHILLHLRPSVAGLHGAPRPVAFTGGAGPGGVAYINDIN